MTDIQCPSCGAPIRVPEKKTGLWWGVGCLVAALAIPAIVAMIGLVAAIAIPSFVRAREHSQQSLCFNQLKILEAAKDDVMLARNYKEGDPVSEEEISQYLETGFNGLKCPGGGTYSLNPIGQSPSCSVHGSPSDPLRGKRY